MTMMRRRATPTWLPLIDTPMHPEYPCAHCITSSAVGAVLVALFGSGELRAFSMTSSTAPGVTRTWRRIADYVEEVSNAQSLGRRPLQDVEQRREEDGSRYRSHRSRALRPIGEMSVSDLTGKKIANSAR